MERQTNIILLLLLLSAGKIQCGTNYFYIGGT